MRLHGRNGLRNLSSRSPGAPRLYSPPALVNLQELRVLVALAQRRPGSVGEVVAGGVIGALQVVFLFAGF